MPDPNTPDERAKARADGSEAAAAMAAGTRPLTPEEKERLDRAFGTGKWGRPADPPPPAEGQS